MDKVYLDDTHHISLYHGVPEFVFSEDDFAELWQQHPTDYHEVVMHGRRVKTPRWQQAYGRNYAYSGSRNNALPLTAGHRKYLDWCCEHVDPRINGLLINWYDGNLKHYIGKHRDSTTGLAENSPIVTISHGGSRVFRFRPYGGKGFRDFEVNNGDVIVIPAETNERFTHEVPHFARFTDKRISVTLRAYL